MRFDFAGIYGQLRQDLLDLGSTLSADEWSTLAPATPLWTVKDLYAHLAGVAADLLIGNFQVMGSDVWTAVQVGDRADHSPEQVMAEWARTGIDVDQRIAEIGAPLSPAAIDLWHHDQDARNAIGHYANRTGDGVALSLRSGNVMGPKIEAADLPALRVSTEGYERVFGPGDPAASVSGDPYEMARAFMGRRSFDQIMGFDWTGDPGPYLSHFSVFPPRTDELIE